MTTITFALYEFIKKFKFNKEQDKILASRLKKKQVLQPERFATKSRDIKALRLKINNEFKLIKYGLVLLIVISVLPFLSQFLV